MILKPDAMAGWTGYKRASDQISWLVEHGHPHSVNARGKPVVSSAYWEAIHGGPSAPRAPQPNFEAIGG